MSTIFDVVVVGSGCCGGVAVRQLTTQGLTVCLLEAGPAEPPPNTVGAHAQPVQSQAVAYTAGLSHLYVDDTLNPYTTPANAPFVWIRGRQLGGRSRTWAAHAHRLTARELAAPPPGDDPCQRWPLSHEELTREYEEVESIIRVFGAAEAALSTPKPGQRAARPMNETELAFKDAIEKKWPSRNVVLAPYAAALESDEDERARGGEQFFAYMQGDASRGPLYSCSTRSTVREALATGRLTVRADAVVRSVDTTPDGQRATGVTFVDRVTREVGKIEARNVMLCASTLESTRALLNSRSARWPDGLANSSGTLGRFLSDHLWGVGVSATKPGTMPRPLVWPPLLIPPYTLEDSGRLSPFQYTCIVQEVEPGKLLLRVRCSGEAMSFASNRVTIDPDKVDAWGIPALRIEYERSPVDIELCAAIQKGAIEVAEAAGFTVTEKTSLDLPGISIHEIGTARMGTDPRSSVVDSHGRSWDIPNLYIADGAVFPRATARGPTLTMMALASRACRRLVETERSGRA